MASSGSSKQVRHALEAVESAPNALAALAAARQLREAAEALEMVAVAELRGHGGTWKQIGTVYGTTKQGAQQRFRGVLAGEQAND
jgi:hypothetical protein